MKKTSIFALILLFAGFTLSEAATKCTITGKVSVSSTSFCSTLSDGDTLWIGSSSDTLIIDVNSTTYASTDLVIYIVDSGVVSWTDNYIWYLGANTKLVMGNGGDLHAPSPCNANQRFRLGSSNIASCSGGNAQYSFRDIIDYGGYDPASPPVPVELMSFDYDLVSQNRHGSIVELNWQTASELNNDRFEVYRSRDGIDFELVQAISGVGTSSKINSYSIVDESEYIDGIVFYKLVQIDYDGTSETFEILRVNLSDNNFEISIFPNPASDQLQISFAAYKDASAILSLSNVNGLTVLTKTIKSSTSIDISSLIPGLYYINVISQSNDVLHQKLWVK